MSLPLLGWEVPLSVPELEEKICSAAAHPFLPDHTQGTPKLLPLEHPGVLWRDSTANAF